MCEEGEGRGGGERRGGWTPIHIGGGSTQQAGHMSQNRQTKTQ